MVRLIGETAAIWTGGLSLGLGIVQALVGDSVGNLGRMLDLPVPFSSSGLVGAVGGLIVAFVVLTVAYWLAEALTTLADVARNTREMSAALREQTGA